jgi:thymidylate synthase
VIKMNLQDGFPALTTKKMFLKGIIHELLWILKGDTNIKYLVDNKVNIWNGDAYRWYLRYCGGMGIVEEERFSMEEFVETIKAGHLDRFSKKSQGVPPELLGSVYPIYKLGDLGKVYGYQWRNQNGVDQLKKVIDELKNNPYSRYHIINAWNAADFKDMALPPCHLMYQFIVRPMTFDQRHDEYARLNHGMRLNFDSIDRVTKAFDELGVPKFYLDLNMYQRSCDTLLGVPFNIASMSLLLMIVAQTSNMIAGVSTWIGGDTHLYVNHIPIAKMQLEREPYDLPTMIIDKELKTLNDILDLTIDDFKLKSYVSHPKIEAELFTGYKKL